MAVMDTRIPLMGAQPDLVNVLAQSTQAAQMQNQARQQNALAQLYQTQGPGIAAGETQALNALERLSPEASLGVQDARQTMDARGLGMEQTRLQMQVLTAAEQRAIADQARQMSEAERAQRAAAIEQSVAMGMAAQTPQEWDALMQATAPELVGQFDQRDMLVNRFMSIADIIKRADAQAAGPNGAAEAEVRRVMELVNPNTGRPFTRQEAIQVVDLNQVSRDPFTNQVQVVDKATGRIVNAEPGQPQQAQQPAQPGKTPAPAVPEQPEIAPPRDLRPAFGVMGALRGAANTVVDAFGGQAPFPETGQAQAELNVLGESILNNMAQAYARQPASQFMQQLDALIPRPGSPLTGPNSALQKYEAIYNAMQTEFDNIMASMDGVMSPEERSDARSRMRAITTEINRVGDAISGLRMQSPSAPVVSDDDAEFLRSLGLEP